MYSPGVVIAGKYLIEQVLGEGGMGIVVSARHLDLGTPVALKFLQAAMAKHPSVVERFLREARAAARLQSENVCRVIDVGRMDDGIPYIVMELMQGRDLAALLKERGPLPAPTIAEFILQASQAIAEAHALGIVHRDLKPANLFLAQRPNGKPIVKVLDFGVAKAPTNDQNFSLTRTQSVMGSPGYMSPEQLKSSKVVDARADIWSLGIVMYELTAGKQPFIAESITELAVRVVTEPHPPLPPTTPNAFVSVISRCLEKDPAKRYPDVGALAEALAPFTVGGRDSAHSISRVLRGPLLPVSPAPSVAASTPTTLGTASGVSEGQRKRSPALLATVIGASAAIGILVVFLAMRGTGDTGGDDGAPRPAAPPIESAPRPSSVEPSPPPQPATEPAAAAPVPTEPAPTEPVATEPVPTKPATTEPVATEPVPTKPAAPVPAATKTKLAQPDPSSPPERRVPTATAKPRVDPTKPARPITKPKPKKPTMEDLSDMRK